MAVAEAVSRAIPVVSTPTGAIAELVGTDAGVLVLAGDVTALAATLQIADDRSFAPERTPAGRAACTHLTWHLGRSLRSDGGSAHALRAAVSGFSAEWLALREPADIAARSAAVTSFVTGTFAQHSSVRIVDLGSGTGSNVRYLSRHLPQGQHWQLVDNDATLLDAARSLLSIDVETRVADLRHLDASLFVASQLVTASALLDLVSESWLRRFRPALPSRTRGRACRAQLRRTHRLLAGGRG